MVGLKYNMYYIKVFTSCFLCWNIACMHWSLFISKQLVRHTSSNAYINLFFHLMSRLWCSDNFNWLENWKLYDCNLGKIWFKYPKKSPLWEKSINISLSSKAKLYEINNIIYCFDKSLKYLIDVISEYLLIN